RRAVIAVGAALALGAAGVTFILSAKGAETTDNAYVQADLTVVAPKVRGLVAQVLVRDNQAVKPGDPLVRLDPEEYDAKAAAAPDLARQDQANSVIRAPIAGVVGARQAQAGDYVAPGSRLLTLAPRAGLYVTANFKETQTARMTVGDPAEVRVDALPGVRLKAHVESFAPGTGSEFALLPFEPGSGNFTKIVQRVPVRIR